MLIVAPSGSTKLDVSRDTPSFSCATSIVTGSVALELDVENADQRHLADAPREVERVHADDELDQAHVRDEHVQQEAAGDDERVDQQRAQQVDAERGDDGADQCEDGVGRQLHDPVDHDHDGVIDAVEESSTVSRRSFATRLTAAPKMMLKMMSGSSSPFAAAWNGLVGIMLMSVSPTLGFSRRGSCGRRRHRR
jgi:hypothetical protein